MINRKPLVLVNGKIQELPSTSSLVVLYKLTTPSTGVTGVTTETLDMSILIPAGTIQVGDIFDWMSFAGKTGSVGTQIHRIRVNTSAGTSGTVMMLSSTNAVNTKVAPMSRTFWVKSATETIMSIVNTLGTANDISNSYTTASTVINIDWSVDQYFNITFTNSSALDNSFMQMIKLLIY
jgi:hypothetical protein